MRHHLARVSSVLNAFSGTLRKTILALAILFCFASGMGLGSNSAVAFQYGTTGNATIDAFLNSYGAANLYGTNSFSMNQSYCNRMGYAGAAGGSMGALENAFKAFMVPSMISQLACPKKMVQTSNTDVKKTFSDQTGTASLMGMISQLLQTVGLVSSMISMFQGSSGNNMALMGFGAMALGKVLGGGDLCSSMGAMMGLMANPNFYWNPGINGLINGGGSGSGGTPNNPEPIGAGSCDKATGSAISIKQAYQYNLQAMQELAAAGFSFAPYTMQHYATWLTAMMSQESDYRPSLIGDKNTGGPDKWAYGIIQLRYGDSEGYELMKRGIPAKYGLPGIGPSYDQMKIFMPEGQGGNVEAAVRLSAKYVAMTFKHVNNGDSNWLEAVRKYNGSGPAAQAYKASVAGKHQSVLQCLGLSSS